MANATLDSDDPALRDGLYEGSGKVQAVSHMMHRMSGATPWWGTVLVGGLGLLGVIITAIAGLIGINVAAKRTERREYESEVRAARRDAYSAFLHALYNLVSLTDPARHAPPENTFDPAKSDVHIRFQLYATRAVYEVGARAFAVIQAAFEKWSEPEEYEPMSEGDRARLRAAVDAVRDAIRREFELPPLATR